MPRRSSMEEFSGRTRGACNQQAAGQRTLAPQAIRLKRSVTMTADDIGLNIAHSGNKHAQLTQLLNRSNLQRVYRNNANGAINLQQLRNNVYYRSSHGSRHFVRKPKSASKIRLVRWPALLETRASRLPTTRYAGNRLASGLPITCAPERWHSGIPAYLGCPGNGC